MDFKLIWSESAINDLDEIVRYICLHGGSQIAKEVGFAIYGRAQVLLRNPEAGSILQEKGDARWRKLIYRSWKIAYRIDSEANTVYVVRVWHAAQDEIEIH